MQRLVTFCDLTDKQLDKGDEVAVEVVVGHEDDPADGHRSKVSERFHLSPYAAQTVLYWFTSALSEEEGAAFVKRLKESKGKLFPKTR